MVSPSTDGGEYECVVSNEAGNGSDAAILYVRPTISSGPISVRSAVNNSVNFSCVADGFPKPTYHWEKLRQNGTFTKILGAMNQNLTLEGIMFGDHGNYKCIATVDVPMGSNVTTFTVATLTGIFSSAVSRSIHE